MMSQTQHSSVPAVAISRSSIEEARALIASYVRVTPILQLEPGAFNSRTHLTLKLESCQHTGSFKPRGAFNRILSHTVPPAGVIAASGGNHGAAVAYAAKRLGYTAEIFVPEISSPIKIERLKHYGAHVTVVGANYAEALKASHVRSSETGALVVHAYDQSEVLAGQGTVGREFAQQAPKLDTILVAVGGGGLIGGIAAWYQGEARVIGVEPEGAPSLSRAIEVGTPIDVATKSVAADSLGATRVGSLMFPIAQQFVERVVLVSDKAILAAQRTLWDELRVVAEPGGATALAAILSHAYQPKPDERVGVLVCGGNTDLTKVGLMSTS